MNYELTITNKSAPNEPSFTLPFESDDDPLTVLHRVVGAVKPVKKRGLRKAKPATGGAS